jgi:hypothetical protein
MKSRSLFVLSGATVALLLVGLFVVMQSRPAVAEKDQCSDAVTNLYSKCGLVLSAGGGDLSSFKDAVQFCRNESDVDTRNCWVVDCALKIPDCGAMANCIDGCFGDETRCGFTMQFIYETCSIHLIDPDNHNTVTQETATAACVAGTGSLAPLFECFTACAYNDYQHCPDMLNCINDCYAGKVPDDDVVTTDDDQTGDNGASAAEGQKLKDVGGSACGM